MLERFVAGLALILALLWGASILATPSDAHDDPLAPEGSAGTSLPAETVVEPPATDAAPGEAAPTEPSPEPAASEPKREHKKGPG